MRPMIEPIVYMTEDGSELYLPVSAFTLNEARHEAARFAAQEDESFRTRYIGKQSVPLHDHWDWFDCEKCPSHQCWCFETYEGTYRR